jgi:hypothetical protein
MCVPLGPLGTTYIGARFFQGGGGGELFLLSIIYRYRNADNRTYFPVSLSIIFCPITINFDKCLPQKEDFLAKIVDF